MAGYAKLFSRILDSTIWRESDSTRILWIAMLALADQDGNVYCTVPGLADRARITLEECEKSLEKFQRPDKYSWSKEQEGRRVQVIDGGWFLINHAKYRALMSVDEQREKNRLRVQKHRAGKKSLHTITPVTSNAGNDIAEATTTTDESPGGDVHVNTPVNPPPPVKKNGNFVQNDFDERDQRILAKAKKVISERAAASVGAGSFTETEFMSAVCEEAGLTPQRIKKLEEMLKWPSAAKTNPTST